MDIAVTANETKTIPIWFGDVEETIAYHPNVYTLGLARQLNELAVSENVVEFSGILERLIASWGLTENGVPIPPTAEGIERVPVALLNVIQQAIAEDMAPGEEEKRGSSEPSVTPSTASTPPQSTFPNGSEISPSPTVSASP